MRCNRQGQNEWILKLIICKVWEVIQIKNIYKCTDWVNKLKQFSQSWIRKPILDIYKCPK